MTEKEIAAKIYIRMGDYVTDSSMAVSLAHEILDEHGIRPETRADFKVLEEFMKLTESGTGYKLNYVGFGDYLSVKPNFD